MAETPVIVLVGGDESLSVFVRKVSIGCGTFVFEQASLPGKLKATCFGDFTFGSLVPGLGATADVDIGVVFTLVVMVEELRVAQVTGHEIDSTTLLISSA